MGRKLGKIWKLGWGRVAWVGVWTGEEGGGGAGEERGGEGMGGSGRIWKLGWGRVECERREGTEGTGVIGLGMKREACNMD